MALGVSSKGEIAKTTERKLSRILCLDDFAPAAKTILPRMVYGYIAGSVETGAALRSAVNAYDNYSLVPRTLVDVSDIASGVTLFGTRFSVPFGIAPIGGAGIAAYRGDIALAQGAALARQPMIMSASSLVPVEEVLSINPEAWFQGYLPGDQTRIASMIERLSKGGLRTLVVTVDTPVPGNRENNVRSGYSMPIRVTPSVALDCALHPRWLLGTIGRTIYKHGIPHFENMDAQRGPPMFSRRLGRNFGCRDKLNWSHIRWIRRNWSGHLILKGILATEDVGLARELGVDGVILSSHGGRQLDHAVAPLRMLVRARRRFPDYPLMIDSGIRRGTDVLKAIALGASAVFIGRPYIFAAAIAGASGVLHASDLLREEVGRNLALMGLISLEELSDRSVARTGRAP